MSTRRKYSIAFKGNAVRLAEISGNVSQTARELGIDAGVLRRWQQQIAEGEITPAHDCSESV